jgi:hypothetical protein
LDIVVLQMISKVYLKPDPCYIQLQYVGDSLGLNKESTSRDYWFLPVSLRSELYGAKVQVSLLDLDLYKGLVTVV